MVPRACIEHTLLRPTATPDDIAALCREAVEHDLFGVCVAPVHVPLARQCVQGSAVRVVTVVGFPFGDGTSWAKAAEAERAARDGARELDMVMAIGLALGGDWGAVEADIRAVRAAAPDAVLKVIVESGYLTRDQVQRAVEAGAAAGADFVKNATGFGPRGATPEDIRWLTECAAGGMGVKAAGGIRTAADAERMLAAGATRIGTSAGVAVGSGGP